MTDTKTAESAGGSAKKKSGTKRGGPRKSIDWEAVERDYRLNRLTERQLAEVHEVSRTAIQNRAKKYEWKRDLSDAVKVATKAAMIEDAKLKAVQLGQSVGQELANSQISAVEAAVTQNVRVLKKHQEIGDDLAEFGRGLHRELVELSRNKDSIEQLVLAVGQNEPDVAERIARVTSITNRVALYEKLANGFGKTIAIQRQANGLDDKDDGGATGVDDAIRKIVEKHRGRE